MKILKFEGPTMRDAIAKVKAELGDQAVIIATRQIRKGLIGTATEISAAIDDDDAAPPAPAFTRNQLAQPAKVQPEPDLEKALGPLRSEMRSLRAMVRTSSTNQEPRGNSVRLESEIKELRQLVENMGRAPAIDGKKLEPQPTPLIQASAANIVMLVGPTGAGKTTTIAKLAARAALIDGKRVKLVTLDNFRVGGVEQIRTFADLIGIPLEVVDNLIDLPAALDNRFDLILIDTAGRSPRETAPIADLADAITGLPIEVHVVFPASSSAQAIDQLVARYQGLHPARLLFTKLDEVDQAGELTRAQSRTQLPVTWVTTGQAVPEDLEEPTRVRLIELAAGAAGITHARAA